MRQKPDPAVNANDRAASQFRMGLQHRVQGRLILPDKRVSAIVLVPIRAKREKLLDGDDKKARFSVRIRIELSTPPSYLVEANASRCRAGIFVALQARMPTSNRIKRYTVDHLPRRHALPLRLCFTTTIPRLLLERRNPLLSFFQVGLNLPEQRRVNSAERYSYPSVAGIGRQFSWHCTARKTHQ
jgi:hypothetical protein